MQKISNNSNNNIHKKWNYQIALKKFKYLKVYNNNNTNNMGRTTKNLYSFCTEYICMYVCMTVSYLCMYEHVRNVLYTFFLSMQAVKLADKLQQQQQQHMMSTASFIHRLVGFSVAPSIQPSQPRIEVKWNETYTLTACLTLPTAPPPHTTSVPAFTLFAIQLTS